MIVALARSLFDVDEGASAADVRTAVTRGLADAHSDAIAVDVWLELFGVSDRVAASSGVDPETRRTRLLQALLDVIRARARREPTLIWVEDLHWLDPASDMALETLIERLLAVESAGRGILLLATTRPEYRSAWSSRVERLSLAPLALEDSRTLIDDWLGSDDRLAPLRARIESRARGNPLFVEEMVRSLVERGVLRGARGAYAPAGPVDEITLPETVQAVLASRIDRLTGRDKDVLQTAAVVGRDGPIELLRAVVDLPLPDLTASLARLATAELLGPAESAGRFAFRHPLTQEVAYRTQLLDRRRATHAAVARALLTIHGAAAATHAALLAHHFEEAGERLEAARWHEQAGRRVARSDPANGARHCRRVTTRCSGRGRRAPCAFATARYPRPWARLPRRTSSWEGSSSSKPRTWTKRAPSPRDSRRRGWGSSRCGRSGSSRTRATDAASRAERAAAMTGANVLAFIGLGVMGEPMCRNLAKKSGSRVVAYDTRSEPLDALAADGVERATSVADVAARAGTIFLCLPGEPHVRSVCLGPDGLIAHVRTGQTVVDMSTVPVSLARELGAAFAAQGVAFADAPVARTAQAARDGTLSIMVGAEPDVFARLRGLLACMGSEVTHCGPVGAGEAVKLMNNMVVAQTVVALAEALAVARASGAVAPDVLFDTLAKGSADSFVLRNHGLRSLLPDHHPSEGAFPTTYIIKDLSYAIALAESAGLTLEQANTTRRLMERTAAGGYGGHYYTAVIRTIEKR